MNYQICDKRGTDKHDIEKDSHTRTPPSTLQRDLSRFYVCAFGLYGGAQVKIRSSFCSKALLSRCRMHASMREG